MGAGICTRKLMKESLITLFRFAGAGLILLAFLHIPISRRLQWREEATRMSPANAAIFHVHAFFICVILIMMAAPCLFEPQVFLERSRPGGWMAFSYSIFWGIRLYCQWWVYPSALWRHRRFETFFHIWFSVVWLALFSLFGISAAIQAGWIAFANH